MKTMRKIMLIGVAVVGLGASAASVMAQQGMGSGMGSGGNGTGMMMAHSSHAQHSPEQRQEKMKARFAQRTSELREKLKLNASQEPAWNAYLASIEQGRGMQQRPDRAQWATLSAPERMEMQLAMMKTHESRLTERLAATKTFYASLSADQQKVFNDSTAGSHRGHGKGQGHGKGHGHQKGHQHGQQHGHQHGQQETHQHGQTQN